MNFLIYLQNLLKNLKTKMSSDLQDDIPYTVDSLHGSPFNSQPEEVAPPTKVSILTNENFMEFILKNDEFWDVIVKHSRAMLDIFVRQLIDGLSILRLANTEQKDLIDYIMTTKELKTLDELKIGLDPDDPFAGNDGEQEAKVEKVDKKKKETPIPDGHQKCSTCNKVLPLNDFGDKPNGEKNKSCEKCRLKKKEYYEKQRQLKKEKKVIVIEDEEKDQKLKIEKCPAPPPKKRKLEVVELDNSLEEEEEDDDE